MDNLPFEFRLFQTWVENTNLSTAIIQCQSVYLAYEYIPSGWQRIEVALMDLTEDRILDILYGRDPVSENDRLKAVFGRKSDVEAFCNTHIQTEVGLLFDQQKRPKTELSAGSIKRLYRDRVQDPKYIQFYATQYKINPSDKGAVVVYDDDQLLYIGYV